MKMTPKRRRGFANLSLVVTFPLAHGVSGRVGLLRGYGNAIVPQVAAAFIGSVIDTLVSD
jgi:hypothetical protein